MAMKLSNKLLGGSLALALAVALAACSGSGSTNPDTPSSGPAQDVSEYQALIDAASAPHTEWEGPTETPTPPTGIRLGVVTCGAALEGCIRATEAIQAAGEALGWEVEAYDGKGDPIEQNKALIQAVNSGADAILLTGADPVQMASGMALAKERNIPVGGAALALPPDPESGLLFSVGVDFAEVGRLQAAWIIADSGGTANVLQLRDDEYISNKVQTKAATAFLEEECKDCVLQPIIDHLVADVGNGLGQRIAGQLQKNPDINYLLGTYDYALGDIVPVSNNLGVADQAQAVGFVGSPPNLQFVLDGNMQAADIAEDSQYYGYAAVDQMIRVLNGEPLWQTPGLDASEPYAWAENAPLHFYVKSNITDPSKPWHAESDYVQRYLALWGVE
jgi:ABC-type sugar transport system substrate-binding protein